MGAGDVGAWLGPGDVVGAWLVGAWLGPGDVVGAWLGLGRSEQSWPIDVPSVM